ncbi:uncharacterized protein LACBIDRAFT_308562 [Laccaria bicolor S238N-H82]|uniref:Predicted protein n=1 Tax=Laccaria bicolor (strain S238N-H82 / ATCC MYA-4686) TaxID=486041 RepID=B0CWN6_LACBS|nr:uncharacterized protein LACBIDRAFT_308562 [Laccaria bicolor S238N-H82]EDR13099.1 predicted protein [Laccaria bicolor S238N-H82]|eukprot:XP_001875597.1 predicted protein [Laccaria bicolor S238N-H82]
MEQWQSNWLPQLTCSLRLIVTIWLNQAQAVFHVPQTSTEASPLPLSSSTRDVGINPRRLEPNASVYDLTATCITQHICFGPNTGVYNPTPTF